MKPVTPSSLVVFYFEVLIPWKMYLWFKDLKSIPV